MDLAVDPNNDSNTIILDKDKRIVASWGTVEVRDREGQILAVQDVIKNLKTMEERGGGAAPIHFDRKGGHGNKRVGKTLDQIPWRLEKDGKMIPGVIVVYQIYKNYRIDDEAWELLEKADRGDPNGINGLSLGGEAYGGATVCSKDTPSNCAEILKDIESHEWTLARQPVNEPSRNITKSQFRKMVDELTLAEYDTSRVINIAKSFVNIQEDSTMTDEEKTTVEVVKEFAKSMEGKIDDIAKRFDTVEKDIADLKKGDYKKMMEEKDDEKDEKKPVKKEAEPADPSSTSTGPEPITKEYMDNLLTKVFPAMVSVEVKKVFDNTGTSQTEKPGTGAPATVAKTGEAPAPEAAPALQTPVVGTDPVDIAKSGPPKKSTISHPSKGMAKHDHDGVPQYA